MKRRRDTTPGDATSFTSHRLSHAAVEGNGLQSGSVLLQPTLVHNNFQHSVPVEACVQPIHDQGPHTPCPHGPDLWVQQSSPWSQALKTCWYQHCQQLVPWNWHHNSWQYGNYPYPPPIYCQMFPWHYYPPPSAHTYWHPWPGTLPEVWQQPPPEPEPVCSTLQEEILEGHGNDTKEDIVNERFFTILPCKGGQLDGS